MTPIVTVVILTYNHEKYIAQAIESVLEQKTSYNYNILIGDDYSTDGTRKIINSIYEKNPTKIEVLFPNKNLGALLNEKNCIEASRGKYIAFLEGDDYWADNLKLQKQVDYLESHPDCGLVHGNVNHYYQTKGILLENINKTKESQLINDYSFESLLMSDKHSIKTMTTCFRSDIVKTHFDYQVAIERKWKLTDLPLWLVISKHAKIHYFDEVLATYRLLDESASRTNDYRKKHQFHLSVFDVRLYFWEKYSGDLKLKNQLELSQAKTNLIDAYTLNDFSIAKSAIETMSSFDYKLSSKEKIMYQSLRYRLSGIAKSINKFIK